MASSGHHFLAVLRPDALPLTLPRCRDVLASAHRRDAQPCDVSHKPRRRAASLDTMASERRIMKRFGLIAAGVTLITVFFVWIYVRHVSPAADYLAANGTVALIAWGVAWICMLSGAAVLARVVFKRTAPHED